MIRHALLALAVLALSTLSVAVPSRADVAPPAHLQITEIDDGVFRIRWRVPNTLPPRAVPVPDLPESCAPLGEPLITELPGAWLFQAEWSCDEGLAGHPVGLDFPFGEFALTTVIRVELLSGDRFAHMLSAGEEPWRLPEGTATPDRLREAQNSVLAGARHVLTHGIHYLFLVVLIALGRARGMLSLVTAFTAGQIAGALGAGLLPGFDPALGEIALALASVVLAAQALLAEGERRSLIPLCVVVGLLHGLGVPSLLGEATAGDSVAMGSRALVVLGMDAGHLAVGLLLAGVQAIMLRRSSPGRLHRFSLQAAGALGIAAALSLALPGEGSGGRGDASQIVPSFADSDGSSATPGSQRIAPTASAVALQSFFVVEPFELRQEVMVRVLAMAPELGLGASPTLSVEEQPRILEAIAEWLLSESSVQVDGAAVEPSLRRADFMSVDPTGAMPRSNPVEETLADAVVGVVIAYPAEAMPQSAELRWEAIPQSVTGVPFTTIDPENVTTQEFTSAPVRVEWKNQLLEDPIPQVNAVAVEPLRIPVPWISLALLLGWIALLVVYLRGARRSAFQMVALRLGLAACVLAGPWVESSVAVSGASARVPSERQARRILAGLIPNVYRAIEFRDEATVYDRLAVSVAGESLAEIYLQQRNALELEERGGAQARVESVEILEASSIEGEEDGFSVLSTWTVGGMVTHFGHRHFRQNRYHARLDVAAISGNWKIRSIEVLEQDRLK